jgi:hypothetical protein
MFNLDDIHVWLRQVESASSKAVETVFPRSSSRQTGRALVNQAVTYAKTTDTTYNGEKLDRHQFNEIRCKNEHFQKHVKFSTNG